MPDVSLNINIPEAQVTRVLNALADHFGYDPAEDGPKPAFVKDRIVSLLKRLVVRAEMEKARRAAQQDQPDLS